MDENTLIVGLQALIESYLANNPETSYEELDDILTVALEEIGEEYFAVVEANNDD